MISACKLTNFQLYFDIVVVIVSLTVFCFCFSLSIGLGFSNQLNIVGKRGNECCVTH